ncbi:MAG: sulfatase-like hydrolase/transferase [Akkermansiaceae bacterium]
MSAAVLWLTGLPLQADESATVPNLLVIMADDLGYADVGFNGCKDIPTPHIDSIAKNGVMFTSGYVAYPVCGPSRAAFITGRYGQRFGFERNPQYSTEDAEMGLPKSETTIASALQKVGYHSGVIGKWHLGAHESLHPLSRGFDEFYGHLGGGHRYLPEELTIKNSVDAKGEAQSYRTWILHNHKPVPPRKYLTDEFSEEAVSFIRKNHESPFFLFLSYNAPHGPLQATEKYLSRFSHIKNKKRRIYAAMVSAMDDGVGEVLEELRETGVEENTLIFFLSDNGGPQSKNGSNNAPLRGNKSDVWEGGYRVPFALQWSAKIKAGTVYDKPIISLDIFGTIAALSSAPIAKERPLDGVNLIPFLTGQKQGDPHEALFIRKFDQGRFAVRHGDSKLVIDKADGSPLLFDLSKDISEKNNTAKGHPERVAELNRLRENWNKELIEPTFEGLIHIEKKGK